MLSFLWRRLIAGVVQLILLTVLTFLLFYVLASLTGAGPAERVAGKGATSAQIAQVAHQLGTDRPVYVQYALFVGRLLHGDLGYSFIEQRPVTDILVPAIGATASLVAVGALLWLGVAIPIGFASAVRPKGWLDRVLMTTSLVGLSVPTFWLAPLASYYLAFQPTQGRLFGLTIEPREIFPIDGYVNPTENPIEWLHHLLLPAMVLAVSFTAIYARYVRALTIHELASDYVRTARAKGASASRVLRRHVGRNVAPTVVTLLGLDIGAALGGVIFVETVFRVPGLGYVTLNSILQLDYPLILGATLFAGIVAVTANTIVDIIHGQLDPRARLSHA